MIEKKSCHSLSIIIVLKSLSRMTSERPKCSLQVILDFQVSATEEL